MGSCLPKFGRKNIFRANIAIFGLLIYFLKKEEHASFIFDSILFRLFLFHVCVEYSFEFRNPFYFFEIQNIILASHFINFSYIHFRAEMPCPPKLTELLRLCHRLRVR